MVLRTKAVLKGGPNRPPGVAYTPSEAPGSSENANNSTSPPRNVTNTTENQAPTSPEAAASSENLKEASATPSEAPGSSENANNSKIGRAHV